MPTTFKSFNAFFNKIAFALPAGTVVQFQKKLAFDIHAGASSLTPVDEGVLRGGWQITINELPAATGRKIQDSTSANSLSELAKLGGLKPYQVVFISNPVEYADFVEDGSQGRPPVKMLERTLQRIAAVSP